MSALDRYPRFKGLSPEHRELIAEFMAGNTLFVMLHELSHAATSQMQLAALDRKEDAADSFAVMELAKIAPALSERVLEQAAKGWYVSDQRTQDNGNTVPYFDDHGIDRERAATIACLMIGVRRRQIPAARRRDQAAARAPGRLRRRVRGRGQGVGRGAQAAPAQPRPAEDQDRRRVW